jgi:hypothetical protein
MRAGKISEGNQLIICVIYYSEPFVHKIYLLLKLLKL